MLLGSNIRRTQTHIPEVNQHIFIKYRGKGKWRARCLTCRQVSSCSVRERVKEGCGQFLKGADSCRQSPVIAGDSQGICREDKQWTQNNNNNQARNTPTLKRLPYSNQPQENINHNPMSELTTGKGHQPEQNCLCNGCGKSSDRIPAKINSTALIAGWSLSYC